MALYDINEFLTLNDIAEYLTDKCNYDFNLECSIDQNRLIETIIQLVRNDKLHPVFHYRGNVDWLKQKVITRKSGSFINHERVLLDITYDMSVRDYYFINGKNFDKLIENNCSNYINVINCTVEPYHVDGKQEIVENSILSYRKIKDDFSINFHDLLYPKLDLDKLFKQTEAKADTDVIEKLRQKIAGLEAENDQLNEKLSKQEYRLTDDKELEPNSQAAVTRLLNVLFYKAGYDVQSHSGTTNKNIVTYSEHPSVNTPITKGFLTPWIKRVQQLRIETKTELNNGQRSS